MGLIIEEIEHDNLGASITTVQREKGETRDPWHFVHLDVDSINRRTPKELRELGRWLIDQGRRIGREYKSNGARRVQEADHE